MARASDSISPMRLDWNDIKARAVKFAEAWKDAHYERGETQTFYNEFFELFGVTRRRVASFEHPVKLLKKRGYLDLFWKGKLLVEQKSAGRSLTPARRQALDYFPGLKEHELPRYILLSDFQNFELYDLDIAPDRPVCFRLQDLPNHVQDFGFIAGQERRVFRDQDPVNILASEIMGALHDALDEAGYRGHKLERFLVRLLFCLFADDTGIFQPLGIFEEFLKDRTREDGADLGPMLSKLFEVLDTPETQRGNKLDADLARFDYINGELFHERLPLPDFDRAMREKLLYACGFNWEKISPAIFGSLFSVGHGQGGPPQAGRPLHQREKHSEGHRAAVSRRSSRGVRAPESAKRYGPEEGARGFSCETRRPRLFRSGLRLR
jgi:hypothetical protein